MDDSSCVMKFIEIVPVDNNRNCSESADVKLSPCHVKVCTQDILYLLSNFNILLPHGNAKTIPFAFFVFLCHTVNEIDKIWQQICCRGIFQSGVKFGTLIDGA